MSEAVKSKQSNDLTLQLVWDPESITVERTDDLDATNDDDVTAAQEYVERAMHLLQVFTDTPVPKTSNWKKTAVTLVDNAGKIANAAQSMAKHMLGKNIVRGWAEYVSCVIALHALCSHQRMLNALDVCVQAATWQNDELQTREYNRRLQLGEKLYSRDSVPRKDLNKENTYAKLRAYVELVNVPSVTHSIVKNVMAATQSVIDESNNPRPPCVEVILAKTFRYKQPWRKTQAEQKREWLLLAAREKKEEEEGEWAL